MSKIEKIDNETGRKNHRERVEIEREKEKEGEEREREKERELIFPKCGWIERGQGILLLKQNTP